MSNSFFDQNETEDDAIRQLVNEYETMQSNGEVRFLESDAFLDVIEYYENRYLFEKALATVENALTQHRYCASLYVRKSAILLSLGRIDEAHTALDEANMYEPSSSDVMLMRAELFINDHQHDEALVILEQVRQYADKDSDEFYDIMMLESVIWEAKGEHEWAFDNLYTIIKNNPQDEQAVLRLRGMLDKLENWDTITPLLQKLTDIDPYSAWVWSLLGSAYAQQERVDDALEAFDYAIVISEKFALAYYDCIDMLIVAERYDAALEWLNQCMDIMGEDAEILCRIGECYHSMQRYADAQEFYQKALSIDILDGIIYHNIGNLQMELELPQQALQSHELAHRTDSSNPEFSLGLARAHAAVMNQKQAHEYFQLAIAQASDELDYWASYLEFLMQEGMYPTALGILQTGREHLDDVYLDYAECAIFLSMGAREEGLLALMQALQRDSSQTEILFELAPDLREDNGVNEWLDLYSSPKNVEDAE